MSPRGESPEGVLADVSRNMGALFRHLLPGIFILCAGFVAHPSWFVGVIDTKSWQHLTLCAVIALAVGNVWFAVNRYAVYQMVDYLAYRVGSLGPVAPTEKWSYFQTVGKFVAQSLTRSTIPELARQHVAFRTSSVLLLYIIAEVGLLFSGWSETGTFFKNHATYVFFGSAVLFVIAVWQNFITRRVDYEIVTGSEDARIDQNDGVVPQKAGKAT